MLQQIKIGLRCHKSRGEPGSGLSLEATFLIAGPSSETSQCCVAWKTPTSALFCLHEMRKDRESLET